MAFRTTETGVNAMSIREVDSTTRQAQADASAPDRSAWVSANAGSGKTHVLAQRVIRLLLSGSDPSRLLCLTFTKAAAAEMAVRVYNRLGEWVLLSDEALDAELERMEGKTPDRATRSRARRLFALALESPGGLKIQTIHAFCERLLHQFPFEAGVAGHFQVLEESAASVLIADARRQVLGAAARDLSGPLGEALQKVVFAASDRSHEDAISEILEDRAGFERWISHWGSLKAALGDLRVALGVEEVASPDAVEAIILDKKPFSDEEIAGLVAELRKTGSANDAKAADRLEPLFHSTSVKGRVAAYRDFFCKSDGGIRKPGSLVTRKVSDRWPELGERLANECNRLESLVEATNAAETYSVTAAILRIAEAVLAAYQRAKSVRGFLDFDDLIQLTLELLSRAGAARWVHYKVDQGIDHILLDEAQDTSPDQWRVVRALADEFFVGDGAGQGIRTLFAVGDEKQSIYSFQGAVPAWFSRVKSEISARAMAAGQAFGDVKLRISFRSTPDIVGAVDKIFTPTAAHTGLSVEATKPVHEAVRVKEPGMVVIWPMEPQPGGEVPGAWSDPLDHIGDTAPEMVLANRIATTIKAWLDPNNPAQLESNAKLIRPGEILILTRRRGQLSEAINRCLKSAGVPVAGADRLALADHIVTRDLIALGDVSLQDRDDLSLATLLRSPLFGLSDEALFALAYDRGNRPLWTMLKEAADAEPFASPYRALDHLRARVDMVGPFEFFAEMLGPGGGRKRFSERLGAEADDVIDEFLAQALSFERMQTPSLQGFLAWIRSSAREIRRETDTTQNQVRVMTVHGAKGLESDIVFLVDDGSAPAHPGHDPNFLAITDDPDAAEAAPLVWARGSGKKPAAVKALLDARREREKEEYRRLLYVASTRARDRLYVCGTFKQNGTDRIGGWHALVTAALEDEAETEEAIDGSKALVWHLPRTERRSPEKPQPLRFARSEKQPEWLSRNVNSARTRRIITPSRLVQERLQPNAGAALAARGELAGFALHRGRHIHRLLEALPEHNPADRPAVAMRYLDAVATNFTAEARDEMIRQVMAVLNDERFAMLFAPGSKAEVDIGAEFDTSEGIAGLSGRIDRLAVTDHEVLIADFKTDRSPPADIDSVPADYLAQLGLYTSVLGRLYPGLRIRAALLWTEVPALMPIPTQRLDSAVLQLVGKLDGEPLHGDPSANTSA
ncbi:MAG: double-strand break repair helicase AddA [Alphaproteobacteria bacterium]